MPASAMSTLDGKIATLVTSNFPKHFGHLGPYAPDRIAKLKATKFNWKGKPRVRNNARDRIPNSSWIRGGMRREVNPKLRLLKWNIHPGDKVRLLVGKDADVYIDPQSKAAGYKVYTVDGIFPKRNTLTLTELTNKRSQVLAAKPPNPPDFDKWPRRDQEEWNQKYTRPPAPMRQIHYSNVQLQVASFDDPAENVYAGRIQTSHVEVYQRDDGTGQSGKFEYRWERYYKSLRGPARQLEELPPTGLLDWVQPEERGLTPRKPCALDTNPEVSSRPTLQLLLPEEIAANPNVDSSLLGVSERAPAPTNQVFSDAYITDVNGRSDPFIDDLMPLYLSEELSNRRGKFSAAADWFAKNFYEAKARQRAGEDAVQEWKARGRDSDLRAIMDLPITGLEGVPLTPRTPKEVRETAEEEFDEQLAAAKHLPRRMWRRGYSYNAERARLWPEIRLELAKRILLTRFKEADIMVDGIVNDYLLEPAEVVRLDKTRDRFVWVKNARGIELSRKRLARLKRERLARTRLRHLKLQRGKNMVVPPDARAPSRKPAPNRGGDPAVPRIRSPYQGNPIAKGGVNVALNRVEARVRAKQRALKPASEASVMPKPASKARVKTKPVSDA